MDYPSALCFGVLVYIEWRYQDILVLGFEIMYVKCIFIVRVDVELLEFLPHRFIAWYADINSKLVGPLKEFNGPLGLAMVWKKYTGSLLIKYGCSDDN